ncbi:MAG: tetratricopeptide repeat protein [Betaproteobacteria bacterium]|nr:tetratricopeptide repeat protein [Betaproteobacteria bacterium]
MVRITLVFILFWSMAGNAADQFIQGAAAIIDLRGRCEYRLDAQSPWLPAVIDQQLRHGNFIRTGPHGRAALLLADRSQIRMNENTVLEVKEVAGSARTAGQTKLRQLIGRTWVQSKVVPKAMHWEMPTAVAGIRGTDWEAEVFPDGRSVLTVLSGEVDVANDHGRVLLKAGEQAQAAPGKPPIKQFVLNARERVQWVNAYRLDPLRHIRLEADSLASLQGLSNSSDRLIRARALADLDRWAEAQRAFQDALDADAAEPGAMLGLAYVALHAGALDQADAWLARSAALRAAEPWALAAASLAILRHDIAGALSALERLTSRPDLAQAAAYLLLADLNAYEGHLDVATDHIHAGLRRFPDHPRLLSQLARLQLLGDRPADAVASAEAALRADPHAYAALLARGDIARHEGQAKAAFTAYGRAIELKRNDDRAWYGRGVAHSEREDVRPARADLEQALALNPMDPAYHGERGTLETFANAFADAEAAYREALRLDPADFVALTGLGLLELKRGQAQLALDAFLKAGLMEPRYARAHTYAAVAYYQLGLIDQALHELNRASELDANDPLPHFLASSIHSDRFRPAQAIASAREALRLMPYLKSLNQLANDQRGSANLGQAFAYLGMEEWARSYAQDSYDPYWAGSHLFLADRYSGLYTKNSELFQGLLADPTVFGASNRFQTLLPAPTRNLGVSYRYTYTDTVQGTSPKLEASGYRVDPLPAAYYLGYEAVDLDFDSGPYQLGTLTAALGLRPRHDLGLFAFLDRSRLDNALQGTSQRTPYDFKDKLNTDRADFGFHYKLGARSQLWLKLGHFDSTETIHGTLASWPIASHVTVKQPEYAFRHSFEAADDAQFSWGVDLGQRRTASLFDREIVSNLLTDRIDAGYREHSFDAYISSLIKGSERLGLQLDLFYQRHERRARFDYQSLLTDLPPYSLYVEEERKDRVRWSPRLGMVYRLGENRTLRLAYQNWLRPAGFSSLGPVATAGIPLDDRLVQRGGELQRYRAQLDWEFTPRTFATGFIDRKRIDNAPFSVTPYSVNELESLGRLRPRDLGSLMRDDLLGFVNTPDFAGGRIDSAGIALNRLLTDEWAVVGRYIHADSRNTGSTHPGLEVPYIARHTLAGGATWVHPNGWYFTGLLVYRSARHADEANQRPLRPGWNASFDLFRESRDKHWMLRFAIDDLLDRDLTPQYTVDINYRF